MTNALRAIREVQTRLKESGFYAGKIDGVIGPMSRAAARSWAAKAPEAALDQRSRAHICGGTWNGDAIHPLHQKLQPLAERHIRVIRSLMDAAVISGHRTYAQQSSLYQQGRSLPGNIVTNARPGFSNHNFALAYDIGLFAEGKYLGTSGLYLLTGEIGKHFGLVWGGDWTSFPDPPHFEFPHGTTLSALRSRVAAGQDVLG